MSSKKPVRVEVRAKYPDEPIERMVKRFSRKVKKERVIELFLEKRTYTKPSVARRIKEKRRQKTLQKLNKKNQVATTS